MTKLKPEQVALALRETGAIIMETASRLGVSRTAFYKFLEKHPELKRFRVEIEDELIDLAEFHIIKSIEAGEMRVTRWYLERKACEEEVRPWEPPPFNPETDDPEPAFLKGLELLSRSKRIACALADEGRGSEVFQVCRPQLLRLVRRMEGVS